MNNWYIQNQYFVFIREREKYRWREGDFLFNMMVRFDLVF